MCMESHEKPQASGPDLLIRNARLIDGTGAPPRPSSSILVENGVVRAVSQQTISAQAQTVDAEGQTIVPGLFDAHVHLQSVPGAIYRQDSDETLHRYRLHHLRAYVACGVTTVLDNAISADILKNIQEHLHGGGVGPNVFALAPAFYPRKGYLDGGMLTPFWGPHWRPTDNAGDIRVLYEEYAGIPNIIGSKVLMEEGFGPIKIWPLFPKKTRTLIRQEADRRNMPLHIHAYTAKTQAIGLEMNVHCFAHSGFIAGSPSRRFLHRMKESGSYLTTTLASTFDQMLMQFDLGMLDDPLFELTVPPAQLQTARSEKAWAEFMFAFSRNTGPKWIPERFTRFILKRMNLEKEIRKPFANAKKAIKVMHDYGIPISLGSDTANWPLFLNFFHGPSTIRELELLGELGMTPMEAIESATRIPAEMMGVSDRLGTIEKGKSADMVCVGQDPLAGLSALRKPSWVMKRGEMRTPSQWMAGE